MPTRGRGHGAAGGQSGLLKAATKHVPSARRGPGGRDGFFPPIPGCCLARHMAPVSSVSLQIVGPDRPRFFQFNSLFVGLFVGRGNGLLPLPVRREGERKRGRVSAMCCSCSELPCRWVHPPIHSDQPTHDLELCRWSPVVLVGFFRWAGGLRQTGRQVGRKESRFGRLPFQTLLQKGPGFMDRLGRM